MKQGTFNRGGQFYHLVIDYSVKEFFKELDWIFIQKITDQARIQSEVEIHALVLMDTHIHILILSLNNKENFFVELLNQKLNSTNQNPDYCEPIEHYDQYLNTYKYIYRNPVVAGIANSCEAYKYSSLSCLLGRQVPYCFYIDNMNLVQNPIRVLRWLNSNEDYKVSKLKDLRQASSLSIKSL